MAWSLAAVAAMTLSGPEFPQALYRGPDNSPLTIGNGAVGDLTGNVSESVVLYKLSLDHSDMLQNCAVTNIILPDGQRGISGFMPASAFASNSKNNPALGLPFTDNSEFGVSIRNDSGGALVVAASFSQMPVSGPEAVYMTDRRSKRIALGSNTAAGEALTGGGTVDEIVFTVPEGVVLDRLIIQAPTPDDVSVVQIEVGSRTFIQGGDVPASQYEAENENNTTLSPDEYRDGQRVFIGEPAFVPTSGVLKVQLRDSGLGQTIRIGFTLK